MLFGEGDEGGGGGGGGDEGLLDHDVLSGFEGGLGEGEVAVGGCGYGDDVDGGVGEHCFGGGVDLCVGVVFGGIVGGNGCSLDDGVEGEVGDGEDEGDVEDFCGEAGVSSVGDS